MQALVYFGVEISIAWAILVAWVLQLQLPGPLVPHIYIYISSTIVLNSRDRQGMYGMQRFSHAKKRTLQ